MTIQELRAKIEAEPARSAWARGVKEYALELVTEALWDGAKNNWDAPAPTEQDLLNGAESWAQYSWDGSALIYDEDIAQRLCTPSELKKTDNGNRRPNKGEEWLDTQGRALWQAAMMIRRLAG
jgi:hypothetical protein